MLNVRVNCDVQTAVDFQTLVFSTMTSIDNTTILRAVYISETFLQPAKWRHNPE